MTLMDDKAKPYNGHWVTINMLMEHAQKSRSAVLRGLRLSGITPEKLPGVKGVRIKERDANRFLAKQWPAAGPLPIPGLVSE